MPRLALCCKVRIKIKKVTCPGTLHLADRNLVFMTVSILAQTKRTNSVFASFPFEFHEKLSFERIFTNASNLDQLLEILEDEVVSIELRQYSEKHYDGKLLAKFEAPTRQFLFPAPSFAPTDAVNRELLLTRTPYFSVEKGIDPKLEFSTRTKIEETSIASSSREHLSFHASRSKSLRKSPSPKRTPMLQLQSSSSETDEEVIITTPRKNANDSVQFQHCVCECQNRPENNGRFVIRSRSVSPGKESTKKYQKYKPPFKVGKAPKDLISKRDFADSPARFNRSVHEDKNDFPCPNCLVPHPDCSMCMAYKRTYGASFLRHRFSAEVDRTDGKSSSPSPSVLRRKTPKSKAKIPQARARIPITLPISSDEDEDRYRAALTVSSERRNRPRMFGTPVKETTTSPSRGVNGNGSYVRSTVKDLLKKNDSVLQYELTDSELEDSLTSDISDDVDFAREQLAVKDDQTKELPDRSIVVPLSGDKYWSRNAPKYTGRTHREVFHDSLSEIYKSLYAKASASD